MLTTLSPSVNLSRASKSALQTKKMQTKWACQRHRFLGDTAGFIPPISGEDRGAGRIRPWVSIPQKGRNLGNTKERLQWICNE
jgi:hypothetical protein